MRFFMEKCAKAAEHSKDYQTLEYATFVILKILQVILNLLNNAIKYSDSGTITLRTRMETTYYILVSQRMKDAAYKRRIWKNL